MFKKRVKTATNVRKKGEYTGNSDDDDDDTKVIATNIPSKLNSKFISNATTSDSKGNDDDDDNDEDKVYISSVTGTVFESTRDINPVIYAGNATHTSEIDTSIDRDSRSILERNMKLATDGTLSSEPNIYHGQNAYKSYTQLDASKIGSNKYTGTQGPIRAPTFLRSTIRMDYQPDTCKDYKQTGFCGYGDNCKFLHDRSDYKSGWQQDKDWEKERDNKRQKLVGKKDEVANDDVSDASKAADGGDNNDDNLPFACHICLNSFSNPVVTSCNHYFCSACIIDYSRKSSKCPICDKQTYGVYNKATKVIKKMLHVQQQQQQHEERKNDDGNAPSVTVSTISTSDGASNKGKWETI